MVLPNSTKILIQTSKYLLTPQVTSGYFYPSTEIESEIQSECVMTSGCVEAELVDPPWGDSLKELTVEDLRRDLFLFANVEIGVTQFYEWLKWAYIKAQGERKNTYTQRDRFLLLKFATEYKTKYPTLRSASLAFYYEVIQKYDSQ